MLRKILGTNFFDIKFLGRTNIKCQNGPAQVFYFNGQALKEFQGNLLIVLLGTISCSFLFIKYY
jgi:hypothetical protein